ncbi:hypothetical protein ACFFJN_17530 [Erwinia mallotivora]|uniref:hypothetical protein n=1 Tax=Erwinia mallotivora TaxID=69222 RepID=UPI0035E97F45
MPERLTDGALMSDRTTRANVLPHIDRGEFYVTAIVYTAADKNESQDPESDRGFFYSVKITFQFFGCERLLTCIAIIF